MNLWEIVGDCVHINSTDPRIKVSLTITFHMYSHDSTSVKTWVGCQWEAIKWKLGWMCQLVARKCSSQMLRNYIHDFCFVCVQKQEVVIHPDFNIFKAGFKLS